MLDRIDVPQLIYQPFNNLKCRFFTFWPPICSLNRWVRIPTTSGVIFALNVPLTYEYTLMMWSDHTNKSTILIQYTTTRWKRFCGTHRLCWNQSEQSNLHQMMVDSGIILASPLKGVAWVVKGYFRDPLTMLGVPLYPKRVHFIAVADVARSFGGKCALAGSGTYLIGSSSVCTKVQSQYWEG
jgi:hypothetical protein